MLRNVEINIAGGSQALSYRLKKAMMRWIYLAW